MRKHSRACRIPTEGQRTRPMLPNELSGNGPPQPCSFPAKLVRSVRTRPQRRSSPELFGRPPASDRQPWRPRGFTAHGPRRPTFSPQNWSEPSERGLDEGGRRSSPDGRRTAMARTPTVAAERIHRTWTSPAYVFPAKLVRTVRTGPRRKSSPELAGRPPVGGGPKANHGSREDSPYMSTAGLRFFPQIWSDPSERSLDEKVHRSSLDGRRPAVANGGSAANRGGREDSPPTTLAGQRFFPQIWSNPSEKVPRRKS